MLFGRKYGIHVSVVRSDNPPLAPDPCLSFASRQQFDRSLEVRFGPVALAGFDQQRASLNPRLGLSSA